MLDQVNLTKDPGKKYKTGSKSSGARTAVICKFHREVIRQILLGNKVILPGGITVEVVRHINDTGKVQPRLGFNYKIHFVYDKLKRKKVKFTPAGSLKSKLDRVLLETDFEYKIMTHGYQ